MKWINQLGVVAATCVAALLVTGKVHAAEDFRWPNGARAAVSLAYDDAVPSQLDNAIPSLNRHGLRGTFYLTLGDATVQERMREWRRAAAKGHELANHTLFHQCAGGTPTTAWVAPHRDLRTITAEQMRDQVIVANTMLAALDGQHERTFAVPCGHRIANGTDYVDRIRDHFVAIKAELGAVVPSMHALDPYNVPVAVPSNVTGQELIAMVKQAAARGTMVNFTFHGIGGDHLSVSKEAHDELLRYLADNRKLLWTDTFLRIMKYVKAQQASRPSHDGHQKAQARE
ncbi:MAG: polysaccharide deacetylase family protein [Telluria sp.]